MDVTVSFTMQNQSGNRDRPEKRANIVFHEGPENLGDLTGATSETHRTGVPGSEALVGEPARGKSLQDGCCSPLFFEGLHEPTEALGRHAPEVIVVLHVVRT